MHIPRKWILGRQEGAEGAVSDLEVGGIPWEGDEMSPLTPAGAEAMESRVTSASGQVFDEKEAILGPSDVEQGSVPHTDTGSSRYIKWVVATVLLFQNSSTNVIMPLARRTEWNSQSGVINQEIAKGVVSAVALLWGGGFSNLADALRPTPEALKTAVPALLFLLQNNLQYVAAGCLSPTLFACLYQIKILSVAVLSVFLLQKRISCTQWAALAMLVAGTALVVLGHAAPKTGEHGGNNSDLWRGVLIILAATLLSGLACVYFEKLLKGSTVTLAARNLQLACYSAVIGLVVFFNSGGSVANFFHGYTAMVWVSICNNAFGGLIVAVTIKYADNIWKNFATTMAIVLTSFVQAVFLGGSLGPRSLLGVALVITAVLLYSGVCPYSGPDPKAQSPTVPAQPPGPLPQIIGGEADPADPLSE